MNFFTVQLLVRALASLVGAVAFAVIFRTHPRHLPFVAIGGLLTYALYYTIFFFTDGLFLAALLSTLATAVFSEFCARLRHAPAAVFLFPCIIPTVPGGDLYYLMRDLLTGKTREAFSHLSDALQVGLGIAGGVMVVSIAVGQITDLKRRRIEKSK